MIIFYEFHMNFIMMMMWICTTVILRLKRHLTSTYILKTKFIT